jgi:chromosomal replication initiator protein
MRHHPPLTFAQFHPAPENRAALLAVQQVAARISSRRRQRHPPLFLHGPAGTGKTHLVSALVEEATRRVPELLVTVLPAGDLEELVGHPPSCDRLESRLQPAKAGTPTGHRKVDRALVRQPPGKIESAEETEPAVHLLESARHSDLLVIEDLQHLSSRAWETLVQLFDFLYARGGQLVFTALTGPGQLGHRDERFPARLTSRLACGLVVRLEPLQARSRLALLQDQARKRKLTVCDEVLVWLAEHLSGGRQLFGALTTLEMLARVQQRPLDVETVAGHFREQSESLRPTVERIAQRVGGYFQVDPRQLQSRKRYRHVLLPRQVGMYLARKLTDCSLEQIGAYFGGRDHSTVLHACRKVEQALTRDAILSGAVRQLHADLA